MDEFKDSIYTLLSQHEALINRPNRPLHESNGIYRRWENPVLTAAHTPVHWRYDLNEQTNPFLMERQGVNSVFNAGAIRLDGRFCLVARVEGNDRKSFFAVAESPNGVDNFRFRTHPVTLPQTDRPDVNVYDMRLTRHEDGYIYGLFCTERKDESQPHDPSAAEARCGIARTGDLAEWERLPDLVTHSGQQRNVVLHPEFVDGRYAFYTRPQDGFISVGRGGGIGWGLSESIERAEIADEVVVDARAYHTIKETKNGLGPVPIKTEHGWLHLAHGVRGTAAGLRYVLYLFMTELERPWVVSHAPGGHLIAPQDEERVGDVANVVFSNGWIVNERDEVFIYYASSDTRMHVATSTLGRLVDYALNTPEDPGCSAASVERRNALIDANLKIMETL